MSLQFKTIKNMRKQLTMNKNQQKQHIIWLEHQESEIIEKSEE